MKICNKCSCSEQDVPFMKTGYQCKPCRAIYMRQYYLSNLEGRLNYAAEYRKNNRKSLIEKQLDYQQRHRVRLSEYLKDYNKKNLDSLNTYRHTYRQDNKESLNRKHAARERSRLLRDPMYKLTKDIRCLLRNSLRKGSYDKKSKTFQLLGTDIGTFQKHLIHTAISNYGKYFPQRKYHMDHIIPCASAETEEELIKLQHYTNFQLLTPRDNMSKGHRLDWRIKK